MNIFLELLISFVKIGFLTIGGGYVMLPMMQSELIEKKHWITEEELLDYYAVGQSTPGIIAVNVATFIGNKRKGIIGGIFATVGLVVVPVIIITLIAALLTNFAELEIVKHAFAGIRVCVCVLILSAILRLWKKSVPDIPATIICVLIFLISAFGDFSNTSS